MSAFKKGSKKLKKGYRYAKGGRIVKAKSKKSASGKTPSLFGGTWLGGKQKYASGSKSNKKADAKRKALKPGKRLSRTGKVYYEYRKNRSDVRGKK
jgi:hypothetical protein